MDAVLRIVIPEKAARLYSFKTALIVESVFINN